MTNDLKYYRTHTIEREGDTWGVYWGARVAGGFATPAEARGWIDRDLD